VIVAASLLFGQILPSDLDRSKCVAFWVAPLDCTDAPNIEQPVNAAALEADSAPNWLLDGVRGGMGVSKALVVATVTSA
jgi:hypothetical protein